MKKLYKKNNETATICNGKVCLTVHGKTAEFVNTLAIVTISIVAVAALAKALQ